MSPLFLDSRVPGVSDGKSSLATWQFCHLFHAVRLTQYSFPHEPKRLGLWLRLVHVPDQDYTCLIETGNKRQNKWIINTYLIQRKRKARLSLQGKKKKTSCVSTSSSRQGPFPMFNIRHLHSLKPINLRKMSLVVKPQPMLQSNCRAGRWHWISPLRLLHRFITAGCDRWIYFLPGRIIWRQEGIFLGLRLSLALIGGVSCSVLVSECRCSINRRQLLRFIHPCWSDVVTLLFCLQTWTVCLFPRNVGKYKQVRSS